MDIYRDKIEGVPQFVSYYRPLVDALRTLGNRASASAVHDQLVKTHPVPEDIARLLNKNGKPTYQNRIAWARFYLVKAGLIYAPSRGVWGLTDKGKTIDLTDTVAADLFKSVAATFKENEEDDAPGTEPSSGAEPSYWFAGASWDGSDQSERFIIEGIWESGPGSDFSDSLRQLKPGDRIAIKSTFVRRKSLPFENRGRPVSVMRIKAIGTVIAETDDGVRVKVEWEPVNPPRDWFFYTFISTITRARIEDEDMARQLVAFAFDGAPQEHQRFLAHPYWAERYAEQVDSDDPPTPTRDEIDEQEPSHAKPYSVTDICGEGAFQEPTLLEDMVSRLRLKKNLILQGPPGTGKSWLARRIAKALIGLAQPSHEQLRVTQFHPSMAYEDFVRGFRPGEHGLVLSEGIFMQMVHAARAQPDVPHVLIVEEINRGNPAQVFGEMLTLIEASKRTRAEALELAYRKAIGERVYVPENLHLIGTMNVADRSLALVDLALRRRFAFIDLEPVFNDAWLTFCAERGIEAGRAEFVRDRVCALNDKIADDRTLGPQFRIGHSYFTPMDSVPDFERWYTAIVDSEIRPLVEEYWFDAPEAAAQACRDLLDGL